MLNRRVATLDQFRAADAPCEHQLRRGCPFMDAIEALFMDRQSRQRALQTCPPKVFRGLSLKFGTKNRRRLFDAINAAGVVHLWTPYRRGPNRPPFTMSQEPLKRMVLTLAIVVPRALISAAIEIREYPERHLCNKWCEVIGPRPPKCSLDYLSTYGAQPVDGNARGLSLYPGYLVKPVSFEALTASITKATTRTWQLKSPKYYQAIEALPTPSVD